MKVKVTQKDISQGKRCDAERCPVAIATRRALKERGLPSVRVRVSYTNLRLGDRAFVTLPSGVREFIAAHDAGKVTWELEFDISLLERGIA